MTPDWPADPALPCHACGAPCWRGRPITRPNGDVLIITNCATCFEVNEFVNGKAVRVVFVPQP